MHYQFYSRGDFPDTSKTALNLLLKQHHITRQNARIFFLNVFLRVVFCPPLSAPRRHASQDCYFEAVTPRSVSLLDLLLSEILEGMRLRTATSRVSLLEVSL